ncbi:hypothetical protein I3760_04G172900 [Carya illinoinensis]|nr:hypothetical protein I3760_04G172900 [Carya illinoinensis]
MPTCLRFLFSLLVLFLLLLTASLSSSQPLRHQDESLALMQFKDSFIIHNYTSCPARTTSWSVEAKGGRSDCCSWDGVECDLHTGHVIGLHLSGSCLHGSINSNSSLFRLSHLWRLNLTNNNFSCSKIPYAIGNLSRLTYLNLGRSFVSGEVPSEVSYLCKLSILDLSYNYDLCIGSLTRLVQNLTCLEEILLTQFNISSIVPESLTNLSSLRTLNLQGCGLFGEFPIRIFQLPELQVLRIGDNEDLIATRRSRILGLSLLLILISCTKSYGTKNGTAALSLSNTSFSAKLSTSMGNLNSLELLDIAYCNFSGSIPNSIWNLTQLNDLDLSRNSFDDLSCLTEDSSNHTFPRLYYLLLSSLNLIKFPNFLRNQNKLVRLDLSKNNIQFIIPKWMFNASEENLGELFLSNNFLIGFENSPNFLPWPNLYEFDLQNNRLRGSLPIPPPSITFYQVRNNTFTGEVSHLFCNRSFVHVLDLSYNNLKGMLHPYAWAKGCGLRMIDLSQNQLQGRLPRSLANCKELRYLDVGYNKIHDTIPLWLETLTELKIFILRSNGFFGAIRNIQINSTFSNLHIIDLSHNNFSRYLPIEYFQRMNAMKLFGAKKLQYMMDYYSGLRIGYLITLTRGIELEYERIQDELIVIDLSCNRFEGEIPEVVGSLKGLQILNFSNNALFGHIPSSLANLTYLESLDLSQNKLLGEIPPQLTQLTFLAIFKVFNNCLTGRIPHGNQFETFPSSSFNGNLGLCGRPLSKSCEDSLPTPNPTLTFEGNQGLVSPFEFGWKVVVIGMGVDL